MRHIITGGAGFSGKYLTEALVERGERTVIFDAVEPSWTIGAVDFVRGDVRSAQDLQALDLGQDDVIYHLAARQFHTRVPHSGRDAWFADVNVTGTRCLLEAMSAAGARRLVFFSTDMTYGIPQQTPVPPSHAQNPIGPYGRSKVAAERLIARARQDFDVQATVFRPRLIVGAGRFGILAKLFRLIRAGLPVPMIGNGSNCYQMVAVEDCVAAALAAVERGCPAGPFHLGSREPPTVRQLLAALISRAGSKSVLIPTPAGLVQASLSVLDKARLTLLYPEQFSIANIDYILNTEETEATLGWTPRRSDLDIIVEAYTSFVTQPAVGRVSPAASLESADNAH
jgi:dTDP-glucose 4,6-dehydratase